MKSNLVRRDDFSSIINIILFTLIFISKPPGAEYGIFGLILLLVLSFFFLKPIHTDRNTLRLGTFKIQGINSLIQLILFGNLTWLHWEEFQLIERVYLGIFCMVLILTIKFIRKQQVKGENSTYIEQ
ncbi:MAG: hypothetical protein AAFP89_01825 [Bacteroidota bacterium]